MPQKFSVRQKKPDADSDTPQVGGVDFVDADLLPNTGNSKLLDCVVLKTKKNETKTLAIIGDGRAAGCVSWAAIFHRPCGGGGRRSTPTPDQQCQHDRLGLRGGDRNEDSDQPQQRLGSEMPE